MRNEFASEWCGHNNQHPITSSGLPDIAGIINSWELSLERLPFSVAICLALESQGRACKGRCSPSWVAFANAFAGCVPAQSGRESGSGVSTLASLAVRNDCLYHRIVSFRLRTQFVAGFVVNAVPLLSRELLSSSGPVSFVFILPVFYLFDDVRLLGLVYRRPPLPKWAPLKPPPRSEKPPPNDRKLSNR